MDDSTLDTAAKVIEALGGNRAVADLIGVRPTAVSNWTCRRGVFPPRTWDVMSRALAERGMRAPSSLWQMAEAKAS